MIIQVLSLAIQGTQLSKIIVDNNGNYYVDGDMTWFDKMKEQKIKFISIYHIAKNEFVQYQKISMDLIERPVS